MKITPLIKLLRAVKDDHEAEMMLRSFFTPAELQTLTNRYELVGRLLQGQTQRKIAAEMGIGIATVGRGASELKRGTGKDFFPEIYKRLGAL